MVQEAGGPHNGPRPNPTEHFFMKKSLIALAVLATTGAAMAQSNVTLYGRIDTSIGAEKVNGVSTTKMFSGALTTSRWGLRGSEDLGGGLKANFQLETGIKSDTGAQGTEGSAFDRQSWVGLSGGFGSVKFGRTDSIFKDIYDLGNAYNVWDSDFTSGKVAYDGVKNFTSRPTNQVRYDTPNLSGFSAGLTYAMDEKVAKAAEITAIGVRYNAGALAVGLGYQDESFYQDPTSDRKYTALTATYDFGVVRASALVHNAKQANGLKDNDFGIGLSVPMGNLDFSVGYGSSETKRNGVKTLDGSAFSLGVTYAMSKRTKLYGGFVDGEVKTVATGAKKETRLYSVGVRHDF